MPEARTLGELRRGGAGRSRPVKEEMRANLLRKLEAGETLFPGIVGYDDSVIPRLANAILSRHHVILLGLRGQAKSRLIRSLTSLLDPKLPVVAGCEIHDDPFVPICKRCRGLLGNDVEEGKKLYLSSKYRCYSCHGETGEGGGGPSLAGIGKKYDLKTLIKRAAHNCPPSGVCSPKELRLMAIYMTTL